MVTPQLALTNVHVTTRLNFGVWGNLGCQKGNPQEACACERKRLSLREALPELSFALPSCAAVARSGFVASLIDFSNRGCFRSEAMAMTMDETVKMRMDPFKSRPCWLSCATPPQLCCLKYKCPGSKSNMATRKCKQETINTQVKMWVRK